jgi:Uma2 family endonuclease
MSIHYSNVEESYDMGSYNHSYLQTRLGKLLDSDKYTAFSDLSLDVSTFDLSQFKFSVKEELKPDVCLYPKRKFHRPNDILKMSEMPLLAIEILSPKQGSYDILEKFKVYFALGIKSCWLVEPAIETVAVYSSLDKRINFVRDKVVDDILGIQLPIVEIFD